MVIPGCHRPAAAGQPGLDPYRAASDTMKALTAAVTLVSQGHVPGPVYDEARRNFDAAPLVKLTMLVATINAWNRIAISFRSLHPVKVIA